MSYDALRCRLIKDLFLIGCPIQFELVIKDYSKTYYGCYRTRTNRIHLYYFSDAEKKVPYSYEHLLSIAVHEAVHSQQWHEPNFVRVSGVMHNDEFYRLYNMYMERVKKLNLEGLEEGTEDSVEDVTGNTICSNITPVTHFSRGVLRVACKR